MKLASVKSAVRKLVPRKAAKATAMLRIRACFGSPFNARQLIYVLNNTTAPAKAPAKAPKPACIPWRIVTKKNTAIITIIVQPAI